MIRRVLLLSVAGLLLALAVAPAASANMLPPASTVKLIFIHHSTGENWLSDANGGLALAMRDNRYFVSDTNYGWGSLMAPSRGGEPIGSTTDIGDWYTWFRGSEALTYTAALYAESAQNSGYTRLGTDPGSENEIVMFKSCFPNSGLQGSAGVPVPPIDSNPLRGQDAYSGDHTLPNAKGIYTDLLGYFSTQPSKLFIVIAAPPLSDATWSSNARAFNNWLVNDWLDGYGSNNVFVFDFYNVLTTNGGGSGTTDLLNSYGNHHRVLAGGVIEHKTNGDNDSNGNVLEYPSGDDHPSRAGNLKATAEFIPLLNYAYNRFKGNVGTDTVGPRTSAPATAVLRRGRYGTIYYRADDTGSPSAVMTLIVKRSGRVVAVWRQALKRTNRQNYAWLRTWIARGTYGLYTYATDESGNRQRNTAYTRLTIR